MLLIDLSYYLMGAIRKIVFLILFDPINIFCLSFLFFATVGYILILTLIAKTGWKSILAKTNGQMKHSGYPFVSLIIPAHNAEETIERKLANIRKLNYPKERLEVIVVDDGSRDNTVNLLDRIQQSWFPELKVIRQSWKGKSSAENAGLQSSKGEIVVISDADIPLNADSLHVMVEDFGDPNVGGVSGASQSDEADVLALNLDLGLYARKLESQIDSAFGMGGAFVSFRRAIVQQVESGIFSSDTNMALIVRKNGYRVVFDPRIISDVNRWVESRPKSFRGALRKLKHLSFGSLSLFIRHKDILYRKRYGVFGWVMAPRHLLLVPFAPVIFVLFSVNSGLRLIENGLLLPFSFLVTFFLAVTFLSRWLACNSFVSRVSSLILMYAIGYYAQLFYYFVFFLRSDQRRGTWEWLPR